MQKTECKLNEKIFETQVKLQSKFIGEVLAETKYSEPIICPAKVEAWANWKFLQYALTN